MYLLHPINQPARLEAKQIKTLLTLVGYFFHGSYYAALFT